jgi:hypothetical protein
MNSKESASAGSGNEYVLGLALRPGRENRMRLLRVFPAAASGLPLAGARCNGGINLHA